MMREWRLNGLMTRAGRRAGFSKVEGLLAGGAGTLLVTAGCFGMHLRKECKILKSERAVLVQRLGSMEEEKGDALQELSGATYRCTKLEEELAELTRTAQQKALALDNKLLEQSNLLEVLKSGLSKSKEAALLTANIARALKAERDTARREALDAEARIALETEAARKSDEGEKSALVQLVRLRKELLSTKKELRISKLSSKKAFSTAQEAQEQARAAVEEAQTASGRIFELEKSLHSLVKISAVSTSTQTGEEEDSDSWVAKSRPKNMGLHNPDVQCAVNSVLQLLRSNHGLRRCMVELCESKKKRKDLHQSALLKDDTLAADLGALLGAMETRKNTHCRVHPSILNRIYCDYLPKEGHKDASEVLLRLLDVFDQEAGLDKAAEMRPFLKAMHGTTTSERCCSCGCMSSNTERLGLLNVPVGAASSNGRRGLTKGGQGRRGELRGGGGRRALRGEVKGRGLTDLLDQVFKDGDIATCEECRWKYDGKSKESGRRVSEYIQDCPDNLLLQLGRFSGDGGTERKKIDDHVHIEKVLDVGPWTEASKKGFSDVKVLYDVEAVVHHKAWTRQSGDLDSGKGHYVAFIRMGEDEWSRFDDTRVSATSTAEALGAGAYILSYTKRGRPGGR